MRLVLHALHRLHTVNHTIACLFCIICIICGCHIMVLIIPDIMLLSPSAVYIMADIIFCVMPGLSFNIFIIELWFPMLIIWCSCIIIRPFLLFIIAPIISCDIVLSFAIAFIVFILVSLFERPCIWAEVDWQDANSVIKRIANIDVWSVFVIGFFI